MLVEPPGVYTGGLEADRGLDDAEWRVHRTQVRNNRHPISSPPSRAHDRILAIERIPDHGKGIMCHSLAFQWWDSFRLPLLMSIFVGGGVGLYISRVLG